ncbi:MAG: trypsin-like peptidase domain-containing protein [Mycobacterium sp.]
MKWVRVAASIVALTAPVVGCGIGDTMRRFSHETSTSADAPDLAVSSDQVVAKARPSVVKVHGESESCQKITDGSGFVVAPHKVMTNAHVVAGAETFSVDAEGNVFGAHVISYDPQADIAILDVPGLSARPLAFAEYTVSTGVDALVLGYPGAGSFKASPAQIREVTEINGPDIYHATSVTRQVYVLIGSFPQAGASGSAVVDLYGHVIGVYFGAETHDSTTGFAITAAQVEPQMSRVGDTRAADTGDCIH